MKNIWAYITLRILAFVVPLGILVAIGFDPFYSVCIATAIGLAISILFLNKSREELSKTIYEKFKKPSSADTAEDED